jgi:hypothetical protein
MSTRKDLINSMAKAFHIKNITVELVDRALAKNGVRENDRRGRGGEVSPLDVVNLSLALMSGMRVRESIEFVTSRQNLILTEVRELSDPRGSDRIIRPEPGRRFMDDFSDLIDTAPERENLFDMSVTVSQRYPEALISVKEGEVFKTYVFRGSPDTNLKDSFDATVTLPSLVLQEIIRVLHPDYEIPSQEKKSSELSDEDVNLPGLNPGASLP